MTPKDWFKDYVDNLIEKINSLPEPTMPVKTSPCETVLDHKRFLSGHLDMIDKLSTPYLQLPYVMRLEKYLKAIS